jgi:hypothetical protein
MSNFLHLTHKNVAVNLDSVTRVTFNGRAEQPGCTIYFDNEKFESFGPEDTLHLIATLQLNPEAIKNWLNAQSNLAQQRKSSPSKVIR